MAAFFVRTVEEELIEHPAIAANPQWGRLAAEAHQVLFDLYQAIGAKHLEEPLPAGPLSPPGIQTKESFHGYSRITKQ